MDLQTLFYVIAIVFMLTFLGLVLGVAILLWYIRKKALQLIRKPQETVSDVVSGLAVKFRNWGR